jgi:hypothetical protein
MEDEDKKIHCFDLNDIAYILPTYQKNRKTIGAISGLVIDGIIVLIAVTSFTIDAF